MDIDHLKRDAVGVHAALKEVGNQLIATKECKIYVPEHYIGSFLGSMDEDGIRILGVYGITVDDKIFASSICCALVSIDPSTVNVVNIQGDNYMEFVFQKGETVIKNVNLVRMSSLAYRVYDEIIAKGKIPWYLDYSGLCTLFDSAIEHADVNLGVDIAIMEMIGSSMARNVDDKTMFYRHVVKNKTDREKIDPSFVGLRSVAYGATNTAAKISGPHLQEGLTSALVTKSVRTESIEELLRK